MDSPAHLRSQALLHMRTSAPSHFVFRIPACPHKNRDSAPNRSEVYYIPHETNDHRPLALSLPADSSRRSSNRRRRRRPTRSRSPSSSACKGGAGGGSFAALERVTPPAPAVLNQLRTSDDFKVQRGHPRFQAIVAKLTACQGRSTMNSTSGLAMEVQRRREAPRS